MADALSTPPPLTPHGRQSRTRKVRLLIGLCIGCGSIVVPLIVLLALGVIRPMKLPTSSMSPGIEPGSQLIIESFSYLFGHPARGDIVSFDTEKVPDMRSRDMGLHLKRIVGLPGETLQLSNGVLYANGQPASLTNRQGPIIYSPVPIPTLMKFLATSDERLKIPDHAYFVIGDNSTNSYDSRVWGFLPEEAILGRAFFCCWPVKHFGAVK